jgi:dihydrofolate synthase/folylpolyglutamate synthase
MELGLERIRMVQRSLQLKPTGAPVITVAGTNGKGSTVAYLEAIYRAAGYKAGCYTSPHLVCFNERVRIDGENVADSVLCHAFEKVEAARYGVQLTYFEFTTLAALQVLFAAELDVIVLEVGLGGRLDAVNIIDPAVAIVTAVGLDHQAWLGDTRELIGHEKAGIFRSNVPAVCAETSPPKSVAAYAQQIGAPLYRAGKEYRFKPGKTSWSWQGMGARYNTLQWPGIRGKHQIANAAGSIAAVQLLLSRLPVTEQAINKGLSQPALHGRTEVVDGTPQLVLDVAHNPQATTELANMLSSLDVEKGDRLRTVAVIGMLKDKDIESSLRPMTNIVQRWYAVDLPGPRAATAQQLADILRKMQKDSDVSTYASVPAAFEAALAEASGVTRVVIFGSFLTVGGIIPHLNMR